MKHEQAIRVVVRIGEVDHVRTNNQCETESGNTENATGHTPILRDRRFN
jgi:hypothetical protein